MRIEFEPPMATFPIETTLVWCLENWPGYDKYSICRFWGEGQGNLQFSCLLVWGG